jgi:hypothetical protein
VRAALRGVAPDATGDGASQPGAPPPRAAPRAYELVALRDQLLGPVGPALRLLQGFAALVLVIACANLANLLLARVSAREREFAVRAALGAGRAAVGRVVLAEGALLAAGGGAAGVLVAAWGLRALRTLAAGPVPLVERVALDGPALLFALGACVATTLAFGAAPALHAAAPGAAAALRTGRGDAGTAGTARLRRTLAAGQMALALVLLFGAALLGQSLARALAADNAGYDAARVVAADVALPDAPEERDVDAVWSRLVSRVRALPGVEAVGAVQSTPLTGKWTFREPLSLTSATAGAGAGALSASGSFVAFDYFRAMGVAVRAGRAFAEDDLARERADGAVRAVMLNETAARRLTAGAGPGAGASLVGRTVYVNGRPRKVVGVVEDTRDARLDAPPEPQWYAPAYFGSSQLVVRLDPRARVTPRVRPPRCARRCWRPTRARSWAASSRSAPSPRRRWPSGASRRACSRRLPRWRSRWRRSGSTAWSASAPRGAGASSGCASRWVRGPPTCAASCSARGSDYRRGGPRPACSRPSPRGCCSGACCSAWGRPTQPRSWRSAQPSPGARWRRAGRRRARQPAATRRPRCARSSRRGRRACMRPTRQRAADRGHTCWRCDAACCQGWSVAPAGSGTTGARRGASARALGAGVLTTLFTGRPARVPAAASRDGSRAPATGTSSRSTGGCGTSF